MVDADRVVADLYQPGAPGAAAVAASSAPACSTSGEASITRSWAPWSSPTRRRGAALEAAIHPLVGDRYRPILETARGIVVMEATLLVETGGADRYDVVVTVEADPELRLRRAVERGVDPESARGRLAAQATTEARVAHADHVLWNEGSLEELRVQVERLHAELVDRLNARTESWPRARLRLRHRQPDKAAEARRIVGASLAVESVDLPEIQSLDPDQVVRAKGDGGVAAAASSGGGRRDLARARGHERLPGTAGEVDARGGRPEGISRSGHALGDPRALARCLVLLYDGKREVVGVGLDPGRLVLPARGESGFGWDFVFQYVDFCPLLVQHMLCSSAMIGTRRPMNGMTASRPTNAR